MQKTVIASRSATVGIDPSSAPARRATESAPVKKVAPGPRTSRIDAGWDTIVDVEPPPSPAPVPAGIVVKSPRTSLIDAEWDASDDSEPAPSAVRPQPSLQRQAHTADHEPIMVERFGVESMPTPSAVRPQPSLQRQAHTADHEPITVERIGVESMPTPVTDATRPTTPCRARVRPSRSIGERIALFSSGLVLGAGLLLGWSVANVPGYSGELLRTLGYRSTATDARPGHASQPSTVLRDRIRATPPRANEATSLPSLDRTAPTPLGQSAELGTNKPADKAPSEVESPTPVARTSKLARTVAPPVTRVRHTTSRRRTPVAEDNPY